MLKVSLIDDKGLDREMGFTAQKGHEYSPLDTVEIDGSEWYLIHRTVYFKYYYDVRRFEVVVTGSDKLLQYLTSEYYETILIDK